MKVIMAVFAAATLGMACGRVSHVSQLAGTPDQDPVITSMRDQFTKAATANGADAAPSRTLHCLKRWAFRDNFTDVIEEAKLEAFGPYWRYWVGNQTSSVSLAPTTVGLQGSYQSGTLSAEITFRFPADGTILYEISIMPQDAANHNVVGEPAVANPQRVATAYALCNAP